MAPSGLQHRRTHNLLLISKLLNQRDSASPFTLILDNLEQSAKPLVVEYVRRAKEARVRILFVSLESLRGPRDVTTVFAWKNAHDWRTEVTNILKEDPSQRTLLIFDALNPLVTTESSTLPTLLSSFISPSVSLLAVYHLDVTNGPSSATPYSPLPLTLLKYVATTIFTLHCLHHILARTAARERSREEPSSGLEEGTEGVLQGEQANGVEAIVLEMEYRRRSGRGVREWYLLQMQNAKSFTNQKGVQQSFEPVILLDDDPRYRAVKKEDDNNSVDDTTVSDSTFELGLTDKQRKDREGVVLPYFDAQKGDGEGGRILYDMGSEDDFDEEEDEI